MKILIISWDNYPHIGGKSTHIHNLIKGLTVLGAECTVLTKDSIYGISFNIFKILMLPIRIFMPDFYRILWLKFSLFLFGQNIKKALSRNKYDVISTQDALSCVAAGKYSTMTLTLTMHTYFAIEYTLDNGGLNNKLYQKLLKLEESSLLYTDKIIAVDTRIKEHILDTIESNYPERHDSILLTSINNFTDIEKFKPYKNNNFRRNMGLSEREFIVLCVRRLVEKNGVIFAVEAMKYIPPKYNVKLLIIGEGPEDNKIQQFIKLEELDNVVKLCGVVDNQKLPDWYGIANCVVVPSITVNGLQEATSISAIEAMASALPVICSDIGGLSELIQSKENGLLVEEKNSQQIADNIIWLINNPNDRTRIEKNARMYAENAYSHISAARKYINIFKMD